MSSVTPHPGADASGAESVASKGAEEEPHPTTICSCCTTRLGAGASEAPAVTTTWAKRARGLFSLLALAICSPVLLPVLLITMASVASFYTLKHYARSAYRKLLKPSTEVTFLLWGGILKIAFLSCSHVDMFYPNSGYWR